MAIISGSIPTQKATSVQGQTPKTVQDAPATTSQPVDTFVPSNPPSDPGIYSKQQLSATSEGQQAIDAAGTSTGLATDIANSVAKVVTAGGKVARAAGAISKVAGPAGVILSTAGQVTETAGKVHDVEVNSQLSEEQKMQESGREVLVGSTKLAGSLGGGAGGWMAGVAIGAAVGGPPGAVVGGIIGVGLGYLGSRYGGELGEVVGEAAGEAAFGPRDLSQ